MVKKGGAMSHSARRVGFLKKVKKILEKKVQYLPEKLIEVDMRQRERVLSRN